MNYKDIIREAIRVIVFTIYPMIQLYGYFVFVGLFCLEDKKFEGWYVLVLFFIYHILATTKVIFYMKLLITEGHSTIEIFPNVPFGDHKSKLKGVNIFLKEEIMEKNITKIKSCNKCNTYKPPRAHHCKVCNRCFLKYDHHCGVLDTCIGFHNYKFFYQFLILNVITCAFFCVFITQGVFNDEIRTSLKVNYIISTFLFLIQAVWALFLLVFHSKIISNNETTVEWKALNAYLEGDHRYSEIFQEGPITIYSNSKDRTVLNPYNLGTKENWIQVFGNKPLDWFRPNTSSIGDGISFAKNYNEYDLV
jgi:palmitoyltransferase